MRRRRTLRQVALGARAFASADFVENDDGTVDIRGVEILSTGGPIFGVGSPPDGDFWTADDLRSMAAADAELGEELVPANKVGHPDEQVLVSNSIKAGELPQPSEGELPAAGWLEDLRVEGTKLLADVKAVPKVVAELIQKGAYRTRSVELSKVTSQETGKTYDWVVTGLAWLGGKMPAVRTLGDVLALYEGDVPIRRVFVDSRSYAPGDVIWKPSRSLQGLRYALQEALNGPPSDGLIEPRWYVRDVSIDLEAVVEDWSSISPGELDAFVVKFTVADDGTVTPAPIADWIPAEPTWIEAAKEYAERSSEIAFLTLREAAADTGAKMRYSADQIRKFAEATGLKAEAVTEKMLEAAGVVAEEAPAPDPPAPTPPAPEPPAPEPTPPAPEPTAERALEARVVGLEEELRLERRRTFVEATIKDGKIAPGQRAHLETLYDSNADAARAFVSELKPDERLLEELGEEDDDERSLEESSREYTAEASNRLGIPAESMV